MIGIIKKEFDDLLTAYRIEWMRREADRLDKQAYEMILETKNTLDKSK